MSTRRRATLWAVVYVPSLALMVAVADTAVRFTHPVTAMAIGFAAFWLASEGLERLTAPLHTR